MGYGEPGRQHREQGATVCTSLPFVLRPMREGDIRAVMEIERRSFPSPWPESAYRYELRHGSDSLFYVLELGPGGLSASPWRGWLRDVLQRREEPSLLGYVGLRFRDDDAHISTIAIHPDWRGRGLGEFLLLLALEKAIQRGARRATLEVRPSNLVARRLYTKVGFVQTGLRRAYYQDGEDACLMALQPLDDARVAHLQDLKGAIEARLMRSEISNGNCG